MSLDYGSKDGHIVDRRSFGKDADKHTERTPTCAQGENYRTHDEYMLPEKKSRVIGDRVHWLRLLTNSTEQQTVV